MKRKRYGTVLFMFKVIVGLFGLWPVIGQAQSLQDLSSEESATAAVIAQGRDYATQVLRSPWDMSDFSDISQGINWSSGNYLLNMQNSNGLFSASTQGGGAYFFLLYAGDSNSVKAGKVGALYPVAPNTFHCLYLAMNLQTSSTDQTTITWGPDQTLGGSGGAGIPISANPGWKLYRMDLSSPFLPFGAGWSTLPQAEWLRVTPSIHAGVALSIDWARLTDCSPVAFNIAGLSSGTYSLWVTGNSGQSIRVVDSFSPSGGAYSLDVQGLDADTYTYQVKNGGGGVVQQGQLTVNAAPIVQFLKPSTTSGTDYATQAGNAWDFNDASNVTSFTRTSVSFANGLMNVNTPSGQLPNGADPVIYLNVPQPITNVSAYRYLSYRIYTQWSWQDIPNGMIVRWIWGIPGGCDLVSNQIPFDVGWQTYSVDLSDPYNGQVIQKGGNCPAGTPSSWPTTPTIERIRFKPNENALGQNLFQQVDWVRLTQVDQVSHGTLFPIQVSLNKSLSGVNFTFHYTDNLQNPTQHRVALYQNPAPNPTGPNRLYLPLVLRNWTPGTAGGSSYLWDTTAVAPGQYYVCTVADDGYNAVTYCSDAPVNVS